MSPPIQGDGGRRILCRDCGVDITETDGKVFTVCGTCWDKAHLPRPPNPPPAPAPRIALLESVLIQAATDIAGEGYESYADQILQKAGLPPLGCGPIEYHSALGVVGASQAVHPGSRPAGEEGES